MQRKTQIKRNKKRERRALLIRPKVCQSEAVRRENGWKRVFHSSSLSAFESLSAPHASEPLVHYRA